MAAPAGELQVPAHVMTEGHHVTGDYVPVSRALVTASGSDTPQTLADWMAALPQSGLVPARTQYWSNVVDGFPSPPLVWRVRERMFLGDAVNMSDDRTNTNATWLPDDASGPNWMPRDSQFMVMSDNGGLAISGASRTSDKTGIASLSTWGVGAYVKNDLAGAFGRAFYAEAQRESGAGGTEGAEIVVKNKGDDTLSSPYSVLEGARGVRLVAGGDPTYGGAAVNPSDTGITFFNGSWPWNRCIVVNADALVDGGTSGVGVGVAIALAERQMINWFEPGSQSIAASIYSQINAASHAVSLVFANDEFLFRGESSANVFRVSHQTDGVNYLQVKNAASGANPLIDMSLSSDTNVGLDLIFKGSGTLRIATLPTSSAGLAAGSLWNDGGTVKVA